ncbi:MAG: OB-fold domain-containing protein [Acidimicrobiia bacterium]|nr:OB-fold domain-containing protein [Acidimicrobiia bacterium]
MATQVPVEEGVFSWPSDDPRLLGSRCADCGTVVFPRQHGCPRCTGSDMRDTELGTHGTLWTWTVQAFPPKAPPFIGDADPATFEPYGVGYVELPGEVKVEARLTESDPEKLSVGQEMELRIVPLTTDDEGNEVVTFAFAPVS